MEIEEIKKLEKNFAKFVCDPCDFKCSQKCDWNRHLTRAKHLTSVGGNVQEIKKLEKTFLCDCGKIFKTNSGLWKHKKICENETKYDTKNTSKDDTKDQELIMMLIKQNAQLMEQNNGLMEIVKNGTTNHSHNTTNSQQSI